MIKLNFQLDDAEDVEKVRRLIKADDLAWSLRDIIRLLDAQDDLDKRPTPAELKESVLAIMLHRNIDFQDIN